MLHVPVVSIFFIIIINNAISRLLAVCSSSVLKIDCDDGGPRARVASNVGMFSTTICINYGTVQDRPADLVSVIRP